MSDLKRIYKIFRLLNYALEIANGKSTKWTSRLANLAVNEQFKRANRLNLYDKILSSPREWDSIFWDYNL